MSTLNETKKQVPVYNVMDRDIFKEYTRSMEAFVHGIRSKDDQPIRVALCTQGNSPNSWMEKIAMPALPHQHHFLSAEVLAL